MANITTQKEPLSELATGIRYSETREFVKDGITEKCIDLDFETVSTQNRIIVKYTRVILNNSGEIVTSERKQDIVIDEGAMYTIEYDVVDDEIIYNESTKEIIKPEALNVTDWDNQLGDFIFPFLVEYVELIEGYITEKSL